MIPRLKWYERFFGWILFRIEAKSGLGAGFDEIDREAMACFIKPDYMLMGRICCLMRDYVYVRMARGFDKAKEESG